MLASGLQRCSRRDRPGCCVIRDRTRRPSLGAQKRLAFVHAAHVGDHVSRGTLLNGQLIGEATSSAIAMMGAYYDCGIIRLSVANTTES
jgi:hypothetical protein